MPTSFLEIVELPDGRIVLRRAEDEEALVTLEFSNDAKGFLQGQHIEIAKAMFNVCVCEGWAGWGSWGCMQASRTAHQGEPAVAAWA